MFVNINQEPIEIIIERKKIKNLYFKFDDNLKLLITCNKFVTEKEIVKLVEKNYSSIVRLYHKSLKRNTLAQQYTYLGKSYTIVFSDEVRKTYVDDELIFTKDKKSLDKYYLKECETVFNERIDYWLSHFADLPKFTLKIRKMKTRWGVCNRLKKTVTLNSELLKKDLNIIDYVIVHELCHFYEGNHGKKFWLQVEKRYPNYKQIRKKLKE